MAAEPKTWEELLLNQQRRRLWVVHEHGIRSDNVNDDEGGRPRIGERRTSGGGTQKQAGRGGGATGFSGRESERHE